MSFVKALAALCTLLACSACAHSKSTKTGSADQHGAGAGGASSTEADPAGAGTHSGSAGKRDAGDGAAGKSETAGEAGGAGRPSCIPSTCEEQGKNCGKTTDGCGRELSCGTCPEGQGCSGPQPNVCAPLCSGDGCSRARITVAEPSFYAERYNTSGITLTKGYAPFPVFFEGWESSDRSKIIRWAWDFGAGTENDELGRTFEGFNAAHVFETPGTYKVRLTVQDDTGLWSPPASLTIEVLARKQANTYYVDSAVGSDDYSGKCKQVDGNCGPWRTATKAFSMIEKAGSDVPVEDWPLAPGAQVLFQRGQEFSLTRNFNEITHGGFCQGVLYGAYGDDSLPKPVIRWAGTGSAGEGFIFGPSMGGAYLAFADLEFNFYNDEGADQLGSVIYAPAGWKNVLFLRTDLRESGQSMFQFHGGESATKPSGIFVVSCSSTKEEHWKDTIGSHMYGGPSRLAVLNSVFDKSGSHIAYLIGVDKAIIAGNVFSRPAFGRTALRIVGGPADNNANNIHIVDNLFLGWIDPEDQGEQHNGGGTRYNWWLINLGTDCHPAEKLLENVVFERNIATNFETGLNLSNCAECVVRNNILVGGTPIYLGQKEDSEGATRPLRNVSIVGNTLIGTGYSPMLQAYPYPSYGVTSYGTEHENVRIRNNVFYGYASNAGLAIDLKAEIPGLSSDYNLFYLPGAPAEIFQQAGITQDIAAWRDAHGYEVHSVVADPEFEAAVPPLDYEPGFPDSAKANQADAEAILAAVRLMTGSPAVNSGSDLGSDLAFDYLWGERPAGDKPDMGAFEFGATRAVGSPAK